MIIVQGNIFLDCDIVVRLSLLMCMKRRAQYNNIIAVYSISLTKSTVFHLLESSLSFSYRLFRTQRIRVMLYIKEVMLQIVLHVFIK